MVRRADGPRWRTAARGAAPAAACRSATD